MSSQKTVEIYCNKLGNKPFKIWVNSLKDPRIKARIEQSIRRIENGNFGVHKSVGEGVWELVLDFGPGYRAYYAHENDQIVILLCAGSKKTQQRDIAQAQSYWKDYRGGLS
jgi:putative addiction module killer protein